MPSSTVEQYIKKIYQAMEGETGDLLPMKRVGEVMEVTPGTATSMVKRLHTLKLLRYRPRHGVALTDKGEELALNVIRRHRLIETFLEKTLGYDWAEVHKDAETLEHAVSDLFIQRLDRHLGFPNVDPHGDPIPTAGGEFSEEEAVPLDRCAHGALLQVVRLRDDEPAFLDLMKSHNIVPGQRVVLKSLDAVAGTITVANPVSEDVFVMSSIHGPRILVAPV
jgi:DtxR family transcriptional regulator, Mn-dependent transcriptional regulator